MVGGPLGDAKRAKAQCHEKEGKDVEDVEIGTVNIVHKRGSNDIALFGLSDITIETLKKKGIQHLFDMQAATFKVLRYEKKDVIGRARTGSGKNYRPITSKRLPERQAYRFMSCSHSRTGTTGASGF